MQILARVTAALCFAWFGVWLLWGATTSGYAWFLNGMARTFSSDNPKLALPLIVIAIPILFSGMVASLCIVRESSSRSRQSTPSALYWKLDQQQRPPSDDCTFHQANGQLRASHGLPSACPRWMHKCFQWFRHCGGLFSDDVDERVIFLAFCLLPIGIYVSAQISRHISKLHVDASANDDDRNDTLDTRIMEEANAFAFGSLIALNLLLILVARHSPLLSVVAWSRPRALIFHRWIGILAIIGALIHGLMHMYRWVVFENHDLGYMITVPSTCWNDQEAYKPQCDDCECTDHVRNLTGVLAIISLLIMMAFALEPVRRRFYRLFYSIHIVAAPLGLILIIVHYEKAIFYLAGGLLYYLASSMPVFVETTRTLGKPSVALVSVELVDSSTESDKVNTCERPCVCLTLEVTETALQRYCAGQYVRLWAPEISKEAHPFTISPVISTDSDVRNHMRIIFRQTGRFTKQLGDSLLDSPPGIPYPRIYMEGFHGAKNRLDQLSKHDYVLIVAGGIGITPYLSLLQYIRDYSATNSAAPKCEKASRTTNLIKLHWVCRDRGLIDYVRQEYLNHIVRTATGEYEIHCTIHYTGWSTDLVLDSCCDGEQDDFCAVQTRRRRHDFDATTTDVCEPFQSSKFAVGSMSTYRGNLPMFLSFALTSGLGLVLIWVFYVNFTLGFMGVVLSPVVLSVIVAVVVNTTLPDRDEPFLTVSSEEDETSSMNSNSENSSELELTTRRFESENEKEGFSTLEESLSLPTTASVSDGISPTSFVRISDGRPFFPDLFSQPSFEMALRPAIFVCGPKNLMHSVRGAVRCCGGSVLAGGGCSCGRVVVYEEAFEL
ncbi:hypothetical protein ACA910_013338 [Epithemia clementina (nom. ined.)]